MKTNEQAKQLVKSALKVLGDDWDGQDPAHEAYDEATDSLYALKLDIDRMSKALGMPSSAGPGWLFSKDTKAKIIESRHAIDNIKRNTEELARHLATLHKSVG
jgi:hypothetical protein